MQVDGGSGTEAEVAALLDGLARRLELELAGAATVGCTALPGSDGTAWDLQPVNPRSVPASWVLFPDELLLQVGGSHRGGRWELAPSCADAAFAEQVVRAVLAGRVVETSAPARSRVQVVLEDGRTVHETGYTGCLPVLVPLPGWRTWGRATRYEPYAATQPHRPG